jgi:hypothetical protein
MNSMVPFAAQRKGANKPFCTEARYWRGTEAISSTISRPCGEATSSVMCCTHLFSNVRDWTYSSHTSPQERENT